MIAVSLVGLLPCAALALCAGPQTGSGCCGNTAGCCCRDGQGRSPAAPPAAPTSTKASLDQPVQPSVAIVAVAREDVSASAPLSSAPAPLATAAPVYLAACAFRC